MMRTILILNLMREEAKLPLRTHYAIIVVGENKKPFEPSRLIKKRRERCIT